MNKIVIPLVLLLGAAIGYYLGQPEAVDISGGQAGVSEPLFFRNPMNPAITSPVPAQDEMGMDYIPVYVDADSSDGSQGTVRIDPVTIQAMGVRTAFATHRSISRDIRTGGRVAYDETGILRLHPKTEGWIEELRAQKTGQKIEFDEILLSLYSPKLVATQQEYLLALGNLEALPASAGPEVRRSTGNLVNTSLQRLELLDVPAHQLEEIRKERKVKKHLHIHSPAAGTVIRVGVRKGQYVTPGTELFFIADLSRVWVYVDIFENELPWVSEGDEAVMIVAGLPGTRFTGRISYIYPYAESETRTVKARLEFDNLNGLLKPDMFAEITILAQPQRHVLVVPSEAIVRSGTAERVFVMTSPGKFEPREVKAGISGNGYTRILDGVRLNEQVVVSAQFLIDSESKLREAAAKMAAAGLHHD